MIAPLIAILLSAAANTVPYPGFETMTGADDDETICSGKNDICIETTERGDVTVTRGDQEIGQWSEDDDGDNVSYKPMHALLQLADGRVLVGVVRAYQTGYAGGGGNATDLTLLLVEAGKPMKPVLALPKDGMIDLRACFGEEDAKRRAGACEADFSFSSTLSAARSTDGQLPPLRYRMEASHFPRGASRYDDNSGQLHKGDLKWEDDPRCTFERGFHFDATLGQYQPDSPLPDCSDYTQP